MPSTLTAGTAKTVITPPVGTAMEGYSARADVSQGVHDDLHARALVIDDGETAVAIVACDLVGVDRRLVANARELACEATGIPRERIMVSATHTHAGPVGLMLPPDDPLLTRTAAAIAEAIAAAHAARRPAVLKVGMATVDSVSQNRRQPDWPVDTSLYALLLDDPDPLQPPIAASVNFACHATILYHTNHLLSADYVGYAMQTLEQLSPDTGFQFLNGACGNVNPVWIAQEFAETERVGRIVGAAAARLIAELRPLGSGQQVHNIRWDEHLEHPVTSGHLIDSVRIRTASRTVDLPLKTYEDAGTYSAQLYGLEARLTALGDEPDAAGRRPLMEQITRFRTERDVAARMKGLAGRLLHPELMAVSFSPQLALLGLPGEWFVETAAAIRSQAGLPYLPIACYANHYIGYVVPPSAYEEGGYEPGVSFLAPEAEPIARDAALSLLKEVLP